PPHVAQGALHAAARDLEAHEARPRLLQRPPHREAPVAEPDLDMERPASPEHRLPIDGERQGAPRQQDAARGRPPGRGDGGRSRARARGHARLVAPRPARAVAAHAAPSVTYGLTSKGSFATRSARRKASRESSRNGPAPSRSWRSNTSTVPSSRRQAT